MSDGGERRSQPDTAGRAHPLRWATLVYAPGNSAGLPPMTPGGLGLVEGFLIPGPIVYGAPATATLFGVLSLSWRLFEFWPRIPVGGIA